MENKFDFEQDSKLNKTVVDLFTYSLLGLGFGVVLCPLFKNKKNFIQLAMGVGAGFSLDKNINQSHKVDGAFNNLCHNLNLTAPKQE